MYRTNTCGELRETHIGTRAILSGWVHRLRDKGFVDWVDLRDRYGLTLMGFGQERGRRELFVLARELGMENVIQVQGEVIERATKNPSLPTGDIELLVTELTVLNNSLTP